MADTTGHTIELPIKSNFREGLDVLEYFMSAHGARKGMADTALRTADSGYLTRRLVDVSQELIIHDADCAKPGQPIPGMYVSAFMDGNEEIESLQDRITGRFAAEDLKDKDGNVLVKANHMITPRRAERVMKKGVDENGNPLEQVKIRTILTCKCKNGVCSKCYGANMATGEPVQVGESVGIIAAQSIGEPGTQLTMRTFHSGGVAGGDITQGLPRVEELFEARRPKGLAIITEIAGRATLSDTKKKREVIVTNEETGEKEVRKIPVLKYYNVFHISQVEGAKTLEVPFREVEPIEEADKIITMYVNREHLDFKELPSNKAFYSPSCDRVVVPMKEQYENINEYYSTTFHELTHSTGHKSRLDRLETGAIASFGSETYSKEELVAEIGSASLMNMLGIETPQTFKNSTAYIQNWLQALKNDNKFIVSASSKAEKAVKYILNEQ